MINVYVIFGSIVTGYILFNLTRLFIKVLFPPSWVRAIPGNRWKPLVGDFTTLSKSPQTFGPKMVTKYGPLYRIWMGFTPVLVLTREEDCRAFYADGTWHLRAPDLGLGDFFQRLLGSCLGCKYGEEWARVKSAFKSSFTNEAATHAFASLEYSTDKWISELRTGKIQAQDVTLGLSFSALCRIVYGDDVFSVYEEIFLHLLSLHAQLLEQVFRNSWARFFWYQWLPTNNNRMFEEFRKKWRDFNFMIIKDSRWQGGMLKELRGATSINEGELLQTLAEIVFANLDVTGPVFAWLLVRLAEHPEWAEEIRSEVNTICCGTISASTLNLLEKTKWFIKECYRMSPVFAISMPVICHRDYVIARQLIPKGTLVCVDLYSLNFNSDFWSDPHVFNPARFHTFDARNHRFAFHRFGLGARQCLGQHFAELLSLLVLVRFTTTYNVSLIESEIRIQEDRTFIAPRATLNITPRNKTTFSLRFYGGAKESDWNTKLCYVGLSIHPHAPLFNEKNARSLFMFLCEKGVDTTILLVDDLNKYNKAAFEHKKLRTGNALKCAHTEGDVWEKKLVPLLDGIPSTQVRLIRWNQVETDNYFSCLNVLKNLYDHDLHFKQKIDQIALKVASARVTDQRHLSVTLPLCVQYIIGELPILLFGPDGKKRLLLYPTFEDNKGKDVMLDLFDLAKNIYLHDEYHDLRLKLGLEEKLNLGFIQVLFSKSIITEK